MKSFEIIKIVFIILGAISAFYGFIYFQIFKDKSTFEKLKELLKTNQPIQTYHNIINGIINKIEDFFGKSFSFKSFDRILLIALVYPVLFFLVCYLVSGNNLIGTLEIFPEQASIILRAFKVCVLAIYFIFVVLVFKNLDNIDDYILKKFNIKNKFLKALIAVVLGGVGAGGVVIGIGIGIVSIVGIVSVVGVVIGAGVVSGIGVVGVSVVGVVGVVFVGGDVSVMTILLFFLLILPIANSIFDFLSFEMSRFLTRKSLKLNSKIKILCILLLDFVIAILLLLGTGFLLPIFIELFNLYIIPISLLKGAEIINWREMAILARDYPFTKGISITLMLFSTLFWTAIHAVIAFISLVLAPICPKYIFRYLDKNNLTNIEYLIGATWLTLNIMLSIFCIFVIPYYIIFFFLKVPIAKFLYDFVINHHFL